MRLSGCAWLALALAVMPAAGCSREGKPGSVAVIGRTPLTIKTQAGKTFTFKVEVARTEAEQERGLMFRDHIAPDGGMLFPMNPPRIASFWMKNCPIPQDWLFIRADGSIARLVENTIPYSLEPQTSGEPVAAVLEIAGGRAAELGISEDDKVEWQDRH